MGTLHHIDLAAGGPTLAAAVAGFLDQVPNPNTRRAYATALSALRDELGPDTPVGVLDDEPMADRINTWFTCRWGTAAPATFNLRLDAIRSAAAWWQDQGWVLGDPARRIRRQPRPIDRNRALDPAHVETYLTRPDLALRSRALHRLLYESAARAEEVLQLDVVDLDLPNRRATVVRKGGAADTIVWSTGTARLLPRYLSGRSEGPVFLTQRRARVELPAGDLDPVSGRARLSYRRAEECFSKETVDLPGGPWDLHQLRHTALTAAAEQGTNTSMLLAYSGHSSVQSLARYTKVSPTALATWQQQRDPAARRRGGRPPSG